MESPFARRKANDSYRDSRRGGRPSGPAARRVFLFSTRPATPGRSGPAARRVFLFSTRPATPGRNDMLNMTNYKVVDFSRLPDAHDSTGGKAPSADFRSILYETPKDRGGDDTAPPPAFFADLNCDQIVNAVISRRDKYNLRPFFHDCLQRAGAIRYRQEVMRDLDCSPIYESVDQFAERMRQVREHLRRVKKSYYKEKKQIWFLDAVSVYCDNIATSLINLATAAPKSRGFLGLHAYLARYVDSPHFVSSRTESQRLRSELEFIDYRASFTIRKYSGEPDYSALVEETFDRFKQGAPSNYLAAFRDSDDVNHIEAKITIFVAKLTPAVFASLDDFFTSTEHFIDDVVARFDREVQFYIAYRHYTAALQKAGLSFCYPQITTVTAEVYSCDGFDLALVYKLFANRSPVVCNDFHLTGKERIIVASGPNQGGKTTFARVFGQLHYLGSIGCPVAGKDARLLLFDQLFTHFERQEKVENLRGKLEDDLVRIHEILKAATARSVIVMNEIFTSTTIQDEVFLRKKIMDEIIALGALCVWVTFVDELASFGSQAVSMVSTVEPDNPALRTLKVVRRPADGLAYAMAIAQKYAVTYKSIVERIEP
jgi:DNA mismatch repair protein MutS